MKKSLVSLLAAAALIGCTATANAVSLVNGLGGPTGFGDGYLGRNDDSSTSAIDITSIFPSGLNFFGTTYNSVYLNNNGNISFDGPLWQYTPWNITGGSTRMIAAFFADVDTRGGAVTATPGGTSTGENLLRYSLDGNRLVATWDDVGYYGSHTDKLNAFQIILERVGDAGDFDIWFRYEDMNWTTGDASGGSGGLGGTIATAGFTAGDGNIDHFYQLPMSGSQDGMLRIEDTLGNGGQNGLWHFEVRNGDVYVPPVETPAPEPSTMIMGLLGLGSALGLRKKKANA